MADFPTTIIPAPNIECSDDGETREPKDVVNDAYDEIIALQTKVGVDGSAVTTTHDYKLSEVTSTDKAVGKTATQTLTNKTLTSPKINENVAVTSSATELNILDGATLSTAELNILDGVTSSTAELNILDGVTSTAAELNQLDGNNGITAANLATSAIFLDYVPKTTNTTSTSGTPTLVSGLTTTVTIPAGGRRVKITFSCGELSNDTINEYAKITIWDGTVGSGTQLAAVTNRGAVAGGQPMGATLMAIVNPAAGSKTYNIALDDAGGGGTAALNASTTAPAFILVELM